MSDSSIACATRRLAAWGQGDVRRLFESVPGLLEAGDDEARAKAATLLTDLLDLQIDDPSSVKHGQFPMQLGGSGGDLNCCLFLMPMLVRLLEKHAAALDAPLRVRLDAATRLALLAAERRWDEEIFDLSRDHKAYTNVFLLYIQALLLGARLYGDDRLQRAAEAQWRCRFNHISYFGVDEFVSQDYNNVNERTLRRMHGVAANGQMRHEIALVRHHLAALQLAVTHPRLKVQVAGSARDYRRALAPGPREPGCLAEPGNNDPCPLHELIDAYHHRQFPYHVRGRATPLPYHFQSWQQPTAALGSMTGGNYFWQQLHCVVAVGHSETQRDMLLVPGSYTIANGLVRQDRGRALCLFTRGPNTLLRTQRLTPDVAYMGSASG